MISAATAWFQQVGGTGRTLDLEVVSDGGTTGWRGWMAGVRQRLGEHIRAQLGGGEGGDRRRPGQWRPGRDPAGGCRRDAQFGPRPSAVGERAPSHRRSRRGDAADASPARAQPDAGAPLPPDPDRGRRRSARRHRLHDPHRRRGADDPLLHRRLAHPRRHRARARGADPAAGRDRRADRAAAVARIAGRAELPAELRGDHRDRGAPRPAQGARLSRQARGGASCCGC